MSSLCLQRIGTSLIARLRATWGALNEKCQAAQETIEQAATERVQAHTTLTQQAQTLRSLPRQDAVEPAETELADLRGRLAQAESLVATLEEAPNRVQQLSNSLTSLTAQGDPRRRRDVAQAQASKRPQVEEALQQLREEVTQQQAQRNALDARLQAFATIDEEAARLTATLEEFQGGGRSVPPQSGHRRCLPPTPAGGQRGRTCLPGSPRYLHSHTSGVGSQYPSVRRRVFPQDPSPRTGAT